MNVIETYYVGYWQQQQCPGLIILGMPGAICHWCLAEIACKEDVFVAHWNVNVVVVTESYKYTFVHARSVVQRGY